MPEKTEGKRELQQVEKLTYNTREACQALGVSPTTLWRMEGKGIIHAVPGLRMKLYSVRALRRLVDEVVAA
jgi:hypothetical protein